MYRDSGVRAEAKTDASELARESADQVQIDSISRESMRPQPASAGRTAMTSNGSLVFDDL